jgi:hypothetical protein
MPRSTLVVLLAPGGAAPLLCLMALFFGPTKVAMAVALGTLDVALARPAGFATG